VCIFACSACSGVSTAANVWSSSSGTSNSPPADYARPDKGECREGGHILDGEALVPSHHGGGEAEEGEAEFTVDRQQLRELKDILWLTGADVVQLT
jgi:hypothetical protein